MRAFRNIVVSGLILILPWLPSALYGQDRCATLPYNKALSSNYALRRATFELWLAEKQGPSLSRQATQQPGPYKIPVVVHIIHNGEPIGSGANITDEQVYSQLRVLNEDFNRRNADSVNTPVEFQPLAGKLNIEFVLARQDPEGLPTTGIVRVNGGRSGWTAGDNYTVKALSYWPAEQYMNVWVVNEVDDYLGYAQEPESALPGSENASTNRLTDGVVIAHRAFGSADDGPFDLDPTFNKGRTATHEVGHFLGIRHIWGDDVGCSGTDYVADTPNQAGQTRGCPAHPRTDACGEVIMFQNFLDYTNDNCMNLFTWGQVDRMVVVLENSPRRNSLLTSPGLAPPAPMANDLGIRKILFPDRSVCSNTVTPQIELRNYGSNTVTEGRVRFVLDGTVRETRDFALTLDTMESVAVSFSPLFIASGTHQVTFQILLTNGGTDSGSSNDEKVATVIVPTFGAAPFAENFNTMPAGWIVSNPDGQFTWELATAANDSPTNKALKLNFFDYRDNIGELDVFLSPVIDLASVPAATLTFDVAHARFQLSNDRLKVVVMTDCADIYHGTAVYNKAGDTLRTAPGTTQPFVPTGPDQWRREFVDLSAFIGSGSVQIAFVGINNYGNNLYIDNVNLYTEETTDAVLAGLVSPSVVTCEEQLSPRILVQNAGSNELADVTVRYSVNGGAPQTFSATGLSLTFGQQKEIELPVTTLVEGVNTIVVTLEDPNGGADFNPDNNEETFRVVLNQHADRIPLRENFDEDFEPAWTLINPDPDGMNWQTIQTSFGQSLYFNAYANPVAGDEAWLVSPVLDFSGADHATMFFDVSYATRSGSTESLAILASTDCGTTFREIPYTFPQVVTSDQPWFPVDASEWKQNIAVNLSTLAGEANVRIAFVVHDMNGNNLYLDNVEFFVSADLAPLEIEELFAVYGYDLTQPELSNLRITFNLPERQTVRFSVINAAGQMETDGILTDVLNQTYPLNLPGRLPPGVYFIRVEIANRFYTRRVLVF